MSYSLAQINAALENQDVKACMTMIEGKKKEIDVYNLQITRIDADIARQNDRKTQLTAKRDAAVTQLATFEADLQLKMANAL